MDQSAQQAARTALLELCRSGSPVVREDGVDEMLEVARRRWQSFKRRNAKRAGDLGARTEDLAKPRCWASSWSPADRASVRTGTSPADDTRFGSSNTAEVAAGVWQSCIYEMPFVMAEIGP
jgi:hypothetical protein